MQLMTFPPAFGMRNVSPFCLKVEMALTHLGLPHEIVEESDPRKAPKGKLPVLIDGSHTIADSELILEHLNDKTQGKLFAGLSATDNATGLALTRLAEEHLYWLMVASRWIDDDWWPNVVDGFFGFVPGLFRGLASNSARKEVRKTLHLHGIGRHTQAEQDGFARRDFQAIADAVGEGPFLFGDTVSVHDFAVASVLTGMIENKPATTMTRMINEYPALIDYAERVQETVGVYAREVT